MAKKLQTQTNYFKNGLVMDLSPTNTPDSCLSNALNATLVTYNGNEFSLQNDMGNGRVETASLPQGYIPVGTCSFGGIIYIVSYNPLENKSQIGCFPSPERNIESDDLSDFQVSLSADEFVELNNGVPTGKVNKYSTKKLLTVNNLNPGDKFVIHWNDNGNTSTNYSTVSNFGNPRKSNDSLVLDWPKLMRVHLVSIEDSGKINYLDSTVQWYNYTSSSNNSLGPFFLKETPQENPSTGVVDIDSYRDSVSGAYSVFQSKVSGKLALLIDLERINTFSASYKITRSIHTNQTSDEFDFFDIYLSTSWDTDNPNVNPIGLILKEHTISQTTPGTNDFEFIINPDGTTSNFIYNSNAPSGGDRTRNHVLEYNYTITDTETPRLNPRSTTTYSEFKDNDYYHTSERFTDVTSIQPNQNNLHQYIDDGLTHIVHRESDSDDQGTIQQVPADILVNYLDDDVLTYIGTVKIRKTATTSGYTYRGTFGFTVAPCMEYGVLDDLAVSGLIDFSQYNYGIELTHWKYSVSPNALQLTWGLKTALGSDVREITSVVMDFYDFMGHAARFTASNYESYNGQFTEYIALNSGIGNSNITNAENNIKFSHYIPVTEIDPNNLNDYRAVYQHPQEATRANAKLYGKITRNGRDLYFQYKNPSSTNLETKLPQIIELGSFSSPIAQREYLVTFTTTLPSGHNYVTTIDNYLSSASVPIIEYSNYIRAIYNNSTYSNRLKFFKNDAGTLYYGRLYQVIITVNYTESGQQLSKTYSRWLWNNGIYNDKQHTNDFDILPLPLVLSAQIELDGRDLKELLTVYRSDSTDQITASTNYQSLGAQITSIGYENLYTDKLIEYIATGNSGRSVTPDSEGLVTVSTSDNIGFSDEYLPNYTRRYRGYGAPNYNKESVKYAINGNTGLIYLKVKPGFENQANFVFNTNKYNKLTIKVATNNPTMSLVKNGSEITPDDLQHLYSDEEKVDKEFIKPVIANSAELNDSTYNTPTKTNLINHQSQITSIGSNDIYSDYGAYGQFKDWFSLEVLDKESGTETFQYNDEAGETQHVTTGYAQLNGVQASSGIGFALRLKGVCYSKSYAYSSVLNNNCKVLKSLLYNKDNWNNYNLAHEQNNYTYFKKALFLKFWYVNMDSIWCNCCEEHSRFNIEYVLDEVTYNSINEANGVNFSPSYSTNAWQIAGDYTKGSNCDDSYGSYAGTFTTNNRNNKVISLPKMMDIATGARDYGFIQLTLSGAVTQFSGKTANIYFPGSINAHTDSLFSGQAQQSVLCITTDDSAYNSEQPLKGSTFIPLAEPTRTNGANYASKNVVGIPVQTISWADSYNKPTRYSDMIASLLGQIYTWDGTMTSQVYKYTNTVTLESYQEVWKKDIVVKMAIEDDSYEFRKMVALEDITSIYLSLEDILARTIAASNYTDNINYQNVSPFTINTSNESNSNATRLVSTQCLAFRYNAGYNVDQLLENTEIDALVYDFTNQNSAIKVSTSDVSIEQNKCYCIAEDNTVHDLEASNKFYLLSNYNDYDGIVHAQKTSSLLELAPDSDLSRAFVAKRGIVRINPSFLQAISLTHDSRVEQTRTSGSDSWDAGGASIYVGNFGMTNKLFNYTNL